jgi:Arc/MetJ-type ribon-helix-helix transcriptional regulator
MPKRVAGDDSPRSERVQICLYPDDLARLDELIADGYAENRSEAVRRSIRETWKWTIEAKR